MIIASDYPLLNIIWTMLVFVACVVWIWTMFIVLMDVYARSDVSGWGKAGWTLFVIVAPFLGVLTYLVVQGHHLAERRADNARSRQAQFDTYAVGSTGGGAPAAEIAQGKELLDRGAISQAEFDKIKQRALGTDGASRLTPAGS
jgi:uncharacterized membrane protein YcjF (UPF0283 family)